MQPGGNVGQVFARLKEGVEKIQARIPFSSDPRLGLLTFCPTNLGTTIRARYSELASRSLYSVMSASMSSCPSWLPGELRSSRRWLISFSSR